MAEEIGVKDHEKLPKIKGRDLRQFLRLSHPKTEGALNVSKWIKHQVLLSEDEMKMFLSALSPHAFYNVSEVVSAEGSVITDEIFAEQYGKYVAAIKRGEIPDERQFRRYFSSVVSVAPDVLYAMEIKSGLYLIKPIQPVVQLQLHQFLPSEIDGKYYPMVLGNDSVTWGLQFSYPQIFQHPQTKVFARVDAECPNTALFTQMAKWFRSHTVPTTFIWKEKTTSVPIRIGKEALSWIHHHPQLQSKGISVRVY